MKLILSFVLAGLGVAGFLDFNSKSVIAVVKAAPLDARCSVGEFADGIAGTGGAVAWKEFAAPSTVGTVRGVRAQITRSRTVNRSVTLDFLYSVETARVEFTGATIDGVPCAAPKGALALLVLEILADSFAGLANVR